MERKIGDFFVEGLTMEYSIIGEGEPILVFHGGHSNCQEEFGYKTLIENGYCIITPSRPGYGETAKEIGGSLTNACTYYTNLLDYLRLQKVHVIAVSAGGPTGIRFASLFPERVKSLILESAVSREWLTTANMEYKVAQIIFRPPIEVLTWKLLSLFSNLFPELMFNVMAPQFSSLSKKEIKQEREGSDTFEFQKMNSRQRSKNGFLIDLKQSNEITDIELETITSPTFIIHSKNDGFISLDHPRNAHKRIAQSELRLLDSWGHLIWLGKESTKRDELLIGFLRAH